MNKIYTDKSIIIQFMRNIIHYSKFYAVGSKHTGEYIHRYTKTM